MEINYIEEALAIAANVTCTDLSNNKSIEHTFDDLDKALNEIEKKLGETEERTIFAFIVMIDAAGIPSGPGAFDPYAGAEHPPTPYNPWDSFCPPFWERAVAVPHLRQRAKKWMERLEKALQLAATYHRSTDSLWEDDETQFGEPLATELAIIDVEFVPYYTRLLKLWDLSHEVNAAGSVLAIIEKHGICAETRELILCYTDCSGSDELDLLVLLKQPE